MSDTIKAGVAGSACSCSRNIEQVCPIHGVQPLPADGERIESYEWSTLANWRSQQVESAKAAGIEFVEPGITCRNIRAEKSELELRSLQTRNNVTITTSGSYAISDVTATPAVPVAQPEPKASAGERPKPANRWYADGREVIYKDEADALFDAKDARIAELVRELDESERSADQLLTERDDYYAQCEKFTDTLAEYLGEDYGEHSNLNDPFENAIESLESTLRARVKETQ